VSQVIFEFYTVRSNPTSHASPRIFFLKKKNNKVVWAVEIDEHNDCFQENEFEPEEAELWGSFVKIEDGIIFIKNEVEESVIFSKDVTFGIETLVYHKHTIGRSKKQFFPCRWVPRDKYKNDPDVERSEKKHLKMLQAGVASTRGNVYNYDK
jgi:hypothetical protein